VQQANTIFYLGHGVSNRTGFPKSNNVYHDEDTKSNRVSPPNKSAERIDQQENSGERY